MTRLILLKIPHSWRYDAGTYDDSYEIENDKIYIGACWEPGELLVLVS